MSLLSSSEISVAEANVESMFDTFARDIVVHKEPIKVINLGDEDNDNILFGYSDKQPNFSYTNTPVNKTFKAKISYNKLQTADIVGEVNTRYSEGKCVIKIKQDAFDYINNGKTEKITFDRKSWSMIGNHKVNVFLGLTYYIYELQEVS